MKKKKLLFFAVLFCLIGWNNSYAFDFTVDGVNYTKTSANEVSIAPLSKDGYYQGAFVIPDEVTFEGVTYKVTGIEQYALSGSDITSLKIGSNITALPKKILMRTPLLTSVEMSDNVLSIGEDAFRECKALKTVKLSKNLETLEASAFYNCEALEALDFPEKLTAISNYILCGCKNLKSVTIGEKVKTIGEGALSYCESLESVTIPASVETIEIEAFTENEGALKKIYLSGKPKVNTYTVKATGETITAFDEATFTTATLYVPTGTKAEYQALDIWKNFKNIEEFNVTGIKAGISTDATATSSYTLNGQKVGRPVKGVNIIRMNDGSIKKILIK